MPRARTETTALMKTASFPCRRTVTRPPWPRWLLAPPLERDANRSAVRSLGRGAEAARIGASEEHVDRVRLLGLLVLVTRERILRGRGVFPGRRAAFACPPIDGGGRPARSNCARFARAPRPRRFRSAGGHNAHQSWTGSARRGYACRAAEPRWLQIFRDGIPPLSCMQFHSPWHFFC